MQCVRCGSNLAKLEEDHTALSVHCRCGFIQVLEDKLLKLSDVDSTGFRKVKRYRLAHYRSTFSLRFELAKIVYENGPIKTFQITELIKEKFPDNKAVIAASNNKVSTLLATLRGDGTVEITAYDKTSKDGSTWVGGRRIEMYLGLVDDFEFEDDPDKPLTYAEQAELNGIKRGTYYRRLKEGWDVLEAISTPTRPRKEPSYA
jgi:hypothetical protein